MRTTPATRVMGITERSGQKRTTFESGGAIKKSESDQGRTQMARQVMMGGGQIGARQRNAEM